MIRKYEPDPEALGRALAARVDTLDRHTRDHDQRITRLDLDITALGRGVADLAATVRRYTTSNSNSSSSAPAPAPASGSGAGGGEVEEGPGQPDWFDIDDPDTARDLLVGVAQWTTDVLTAHGLTLPAACWPLHPDVVAELLALQAERDAAYDGDRPTAVSEWLARWLPTARDRITTALTGCVAERGHRHNGHTYAITATARPDGSDGLDPRDLASIAAWWATDRATPTPQAFGLTPLD